MFVKRMYEILCFLFRTGNREHVPVAQGASGNRKGHGQRLSFAFLVISDTLPCFAPCANIYLQVVSFKFITLVHSHSEISTPVSFLWGELFEILAFAIFGLAQRTSFIFHVYLYIWISPGEGMSVIGVTRRLFLSRFSLNSI